MIPLNKHTIQHHLTAHPAHKTTTIHLFESIDSTNRYLKEHPETQALEVCCAETQTAGRGRFGRTWHSPFGQNIYCSIRTPIKTQGAALSGLSLMVSLAVLAVLDELSSHQDILIKWPNDLLWNGKKLSGSLVELLYHNTQITSIIIGIGINVNSSACQDNSLDRPWCSLYDIFNQHFDRNVLIARLIIHLNNYLNTFMREGLSECLPIWKQRDYLSEQWITVSTPNGLLSGQAKGVNQWGNLIIIDETGHKHELSSGEVSLRV